MRPSHLLVANPTAQSGKNRARITRAVTRFERQGVGVEVLPTLPAGGTIGAVRDALEQGSHGVVITMGGDGTFREVAEGLIASGRAEEVALGMLPSGTANDQGRSFGLDSHDAALEDNVDIIVRGAETRLDGGRIRGLSDAGDELAAAWFFDSAGWGLSARVLAVRNKDRDFVGKLGLLKELYRDKWVYAGALLRVFADSYVVSDKFDALVVADGVTQELTGLSDLIVKGTRIYGGAWVVDPASRHDDGRFEVVPFRGKRDWASKAIVDLDGNPLSEEMLNAVGVSHSHPFSATRIELTFDLTAHGAAGRAHAAHAAQIDGEEWMATPRAVIDVHPRIIRLIVP